MQSLPPVIGMLTIDDLPALPPAQFAPLVIRVVKSSSRRVFESFPLTTRRLEGSSTRRVIQTLNAQANRRANAQ
jgi:hypothetical protein